MEVLSSYGSRDRLNKCYQNYGRTVRVHLDTTISSTSPEKIDFDQLIHTVSELKRSIESDTYGLVHLETDLSMIASKLSQIREGDLHIDHQIVSRIKTATTNFSSLCVIKNNFPDIVQ